MAQAKTLVAGLAGRYASALFDLARTDKAVDSVSASLASVGAALTESADFAALIKSPRISRGAAKSAVAGLADAMKLDDLTARFLGVLADNRRLSALPDILAAFRTIEAAFKGETSAEVTAAQPLTAEQQDALKAKLKANLKKDVSINVKVDPSILGGLIVKVGSRMIDSSLKTKLDQLAVQMKG